MLALLIGRSDEANALGRRSGLPNPGFEKGGEKARE